MRAADVSMQIGTSAAGYGWLRAVTPLACAVLIAEFMATSACVPLIFNIGHRSAVVRFGVGRRC
jgi:hypothetical protein